MIRDNKHSLKNQLTSRINSIKKLKNADFRTKLMVATGLIQSKLQYLMALYGGCPDYLLQGLQVQQLNACRAVCGYKSYYWSAHKLLNTCKWISVKQQIVYSTALTAHKIVTTGKPVNIYSTLVTPHPYQTRAATRGNIRYGENYGGQTLLTLNSFRYRAQRIYSALPQTVTNNNITIFKKRLKKYVKENIPLR